MSTPLRASQLYAISQGVNCEGRESCYYCGGPCTQGLLHTERRLSIGMKRTVPAKVLHSPYLCVGCWLFRRQRLTVSFLGGLYKDRQCPVNHSWWVTEKGAWGVGKADCAEVYECLLDPPKKFFLSLLDGGSDNHIQLAVANDNQEVRADTPLNFTVNNIQHTYTTYELSEALKHGPDGKEPGVRALIKIFGNYDGVIEPKQQIVLKEGEKRPVGRPPSLNKNEFTEPKERAVKKVIRRSGGQ